MKRVLLAFVLTTCMVGTAAAHAIELPDLSSFEEAGLPSSALIIGVYGAHIDDFDYATLGYRQLRSSGMTAYALDYFNAQL